MAFPAESINTSTFKSKTRSREIPRGFRSSLGSVLLSDGHVASLSPSLVWRMSFALLIGSSPPRATMNPPPCFELDEFCPCGELVEGVGLGDGDGVDPLAWLPLLVDELETVEGVCVPDGLF